MRAEIEKAVQLLRDGDDANVEQALGLLQDSVCELQEHQEDRPA